MNKAKSVILFLIIILVIVAIAIYAKDGYISRRDNADSYTIGKDTVISVKSVVGKRNITNVSSKLERGILTKKYVYNIDKNIIDDVTKYTDKLKENGFLTVTKPDLSQSSGTAKYGKASIESGKVVFVEISYNAQGYTITLLSGTGTISKSNSN